MEDDKKKTKDKQEKNNPEEEGGQVPYTNWMEWLITVSRRILAEGE